MGVSRTTAEFHRKLNRIPAAVEKAEKKALMANADLAERNARTELARVVRSGRLKNAGALVRAGAAGSRVVGRRGASLGVSKKPLGKGQIGVRATGPWQLIETNNAPHVISPAGAGKLRLAGPARPAVRPQRGAEGPVLRGGRSPRTASGRTTVTARSGRAKALRTPWGLKAYVVHRGTKGRRPWAKAAERTIKAAPATLQRVTRDEVAAVMR